MKYSIRFGDMRPCLRAKSRQSAEQLVRFSAGQAGHRRLYTRGTDWLEFYPTREARELADGADDATNAFAVIVPL